MRVLTVLILLWRNDISSFVVVLILKFEQGNITTDLQVMIMVLTSTEKLKNYQQLFI